MSADNDTHFGFQQVAEGEKSARVREVFKSVAPSYDVMNDLMSGGLHRLWKRFTVALANVKAGRRKVTAPVYSHFSYDILPGEEIVVDQPDILIVEGLNVLQPARPPKDGEAIPFVSDFFDFSIYIDAPSEIIEQWYLERFLRLRETAFRDPAAYFHRYASLNDQQARDRGERHQQRRGVELDEAVGLGEDHDADRGDHGRERGGLDARP